jgi:hypothetical protein
MMVFDKIPNWILAAAFFGFIFTGPVAAGSWYFGGAIAGIIAIALLIIYFIVLYVVAIRRYIER